MLRPPRAHALTLGLLGLLGPLSTAACDRPAPKLPVGRVSDGVPLDDREAVVFVVDLDGDGPVLGLVDERGAPRWVHPLSPEEFKDRYSTPDMAITPELVLLSGDGVHAFERTTGARRWLRAGERPIAASAEDGLIISLGFEELDVLDPATGATVWSVAAPEHTSLHYLTAGHVARTTHVRRAIKPDGTESTDTGVRERLEVVHGPTGAVVWADDLVGHCRIDHELLAMTRGGGLVALDLSADPVRPRTVAPAGALPTPKLWGLAGCSKRGGTWWLRQDLFDDATLFTAIDPATGAGKQIGVCNVVADAGRVVLTRGHDDGNLRAYDLDAGKLTWGQDPEIHKPRYTRAFTAGELVYLTTEYEYEKIQHVLAFDPNADEVTGAVALRGAVEFRPQDGAHWVFSAGYGPRGGAALAVLGHRDLRPQLPPPADLDVVDTLAEVRASRQDPGTALVFDPIWDFTRLRDESEDPDGPCRDVRRPGWGTPGFEF